MLSSLPSVHWIFYCALLLNLVEADEIIKTIEIPEADNPNRILLNVTEVIVDRKKLMLNDEISIHMLTPGGMDPFVLMKKQLLGVKSKIDREEICKNSDKQPPPNCSLKECCVFFGVTAKINQKSHIFFVLIKILDVNDNLPKFDINKINQPFKEISENAKRGEIIELPIAHDADTEEFSVKSYELRKPFLKGNAEDFQFLIKNNRPYLKVVRLDHELCGLYEFELVAYDYNRRNTKLSRQAGRVKLQIAVVDENDNVPILEIIKKKDQIQENTEYIDVVEFKVSDKDSGNNGKVTVSLEGEKAVVSKFQVIQQTSQNNGFVRLNSRFDLEQGQDRVNFVMVARDHGGMQPLSSRETVHIKILNDNDNPPLIKLIKDGKFIDNSLVVREDTPVNSEIVYVYVTDKDTNFNQIECTLQNYESYFMLELQPPSNILKKKRYHLKLLLPLDHERPNGPMLRVEIRCDDKEPRNNLHSSVYLRVHIGDVNDNKPRFSKALYNGKVKENEVAATVQFLQPISVQDMDANQNGKFLYSLRFLNASDALLFHCDANSGDITTKDALDYEKRQKYRFIIIAKDQGTPKQLSSSATVIVNVVDVNDNMPTFSETHYTFSIREDAKVGSKIGKVVAHDRDTLKENKGVKYRFSFNNLQNMHLMNSDLDRNMRSIKRYVMEHIHLNRDTGELTTRKALNYELFPSVNFQIVAKNQQPPFYGNRNNDYNHINYLSTKSEVSVIIKVLNVNDNQPKFKLIKGKKAHLEFVYNDQTSNCKKIPYQVIDNDVLADHNKATGCCEISIENDHNGLFSLMSSDHPIYMCVSKKPSGQQSFTLTLVAKDRIIRDNDRTFESKITFPVVISEYRKPPFISTGDNPKDNSFPKDNGNGYGVNNNNGYSNNGYGASDKNRTNKGDLKNVIIVGVLVAVVVAFLIIVVIIIIIIRRCSYVNDPDYDNPKSNATAASMSVENHYQERSATILSHRNPQPMGNPGMMSPANQSHNTLNSSINMIPQLYHQLDLSTSSPALQNGPPRSTQIFYNQQTSPAQAAHYQMLNPYHTNIEYSPSPPQLLLEQQHNATLRNQAHKSLSNLSEPNILEPHTYQEPLLQHHNVTDNEIADNNTDYLSKTTPHNQALLVQNSNIIDTPNTTKRNYVQTTFV